MVEANLILVDTSTWIASIRPNTDIDLQIQTVLRQSLFAGTIVTAPIITLELLQGTRTHGEYNELKVMLQALRQLPMTAHLWDRACSLGFQLRRRGLTIPTTDVIIAALAMEYDCALLHQDRHFPMMQT